MKRIFSTTILCALVGAFLFTLFVPAQAQKPKPAAPAANANCTRSNDELVKDIYEQLKKDKVLGTQWRQIIVTAQDGVVRLRGWTLGRAAKIRAQKLVAATACVKKVNSQLSPKRTGSCPDGQKPCGDGGCIGADENCTIN